MAAWEQSLQELVRTRGTALVGYAYLLRGDRREAEDLVQDALVKTYSRGRVGTHPDNVEGYVRKAILSRFLDGFRRRKRWAAVRHLVTTDDAAPGHETTVGARVDVRGRGSSIPVPRPRTPGPAASPGSPPGTSPPPAAPTRTPTSCATASTRCGRAPRWSGRRGQHPPGSGGRAGAGPGHRALVVGVFEVVDPEVHRPVDDRPGLGLAVGLGRPLHRGARPQRVLAVAQDVGVRVGAAGGGDVPGGLPGL